MYVLINLDDLKFEATGGYWTLCELSYTKFPDKETMISDASADHTYMCLKEAQLRELYKNTGGKDSAGISKWELPKACKELAMLIAPLPPHPESPSLQQPALPPEAPKTAPMTSKPEDSQRPKAGTQTGRVWEIADEETEKHLLHKHQVCQDSTFFKGFKEDVVKRCQQEGINPSTAQVQLSKWKKHQ